MQKTGYVPYEVVKQAVPILDAADWLKVKYKKEGETLRGECPHAGGDRSIVITPSKSLFYCFACNEGGSVIDLTAHIHGVGLKEAAQALMREFMHERRTNPVDGEPIVPKGMKPLEHLSHDAVILGPLKPIAEAVGIGTTGKGMMRGMIAVPLRMKDGTLIGYVGIPAGTVLKVPDKWHT